MKIYDCVHGFIHLNDLEGLLIDTEVFQRLRYIHQLGISYMVYPGGTHTRFEHSLGTMHLTSQIFDQLPKHDDREYWRQILRLSALCHDLGHLPFSHVAEKTLLGKAGHEEWTLKIIESSHLQPVWDAMEKRYPNQSIRQHVMKCSLGQEKLKSLRPDMAFTPFEKIYSQVITGDFFGSDRIDYLLRDARATGLSYGLFDYMQLIEMLTVIEDKQGELTLGVEENGIASCEALLLARHFMQRRVYQYPSARAYSFHMARFMKQLYSSSHYLENVENYLTMTEYEVLFEMQKASNDPNHPAHYDAGALFGKRKRFQAIDLPHQIEERELLGYKQKFKLSDADIHWDISSRDTTQYGLSLLIRKKNSEVIPASHCSEIAVPSTKKNWLYLAPEYNYPL